MYDSQSMHHAAAAGVFAGLVALSSGIPAIPAAAILVTVVVAWILVVYRSVPMDNFPTVKTSMVCWVLFVPNEQLRYLCD
jgi:hypothetical protein